MHEGRWLTKITIGLDTIETSVKPLKTTDHVPALSGLQIGIVKKIHDDPAEAFRVLVTLPLINGSDDGIWARLGNVFASNKSGSFFCPEVGDEVIIGFLNDNPSAPIILGSLYSKKNPPCVTPDEKNTHKSITTRTGMTIEFNEEHKTITFKTPGNNVITLSDTDKQITIQDENSNSFVMSESGIVMKSPKDISIEADQNVTIKGKQGVSIESSGGDVTISGVNIKESAAVEYAAEGSATASVQGGGQLTLQGAMVMIN